MNSLVSHTFTKIGSIQVVSSFITLWLLGLAVSRLYLSPIAKFPGPKLAALTSWYEFYFDVVEGGQFTFHLQELHKRYGPIIRINPNELHIDDPEYYETIYSHSLHLDKMPAFTHRFQNPDSIQTTVPHALHRLRRQPLNQFFSKRQVLLLWPLVVEKCEKLCQKIDEKYTDTGKILELSRAYSCFSIDVITEYAFGRCYNDLDNPDLDSPMRKVIHGQTAKVHIVTHLPWFLKLMKALPRSILHYLNPSFIVVERYHKATAAHIQELVRQKQVKIEMTGHKTIFSELLNSDLPPEELGIKRLGDEANITLGAATETTKGALTVATFHLLNNPTLHKKLREELVSAIPEKDTILQLSELEKLPYLTACIQEGLRLSYGVAQRSPRISPKEPLQYKDQIIPPGYPVSLDAVHMHHNETIFPKSHEFSPERWLDENKKDKDSKTEKRLDRYMVAFTRGTRQCIGINLAWAEMYLMLSTMFRRYEMELYETDVDSVKIYAEYFLPAVKLGKEGIKVLVRKSEM